MTFDNSCFIILYKCTFIYYNLTTSPYWKDTAENEFCCSFIKSMGKGCTSRTCLHLKYMPGFIYFKHTSYYISLENAVKWLLCDNLFSEFVFASVYDQISLCFELHCDCKKINDVILLLMN